MDKTITLKISAEEIAKITPNMQGIFFEDINYAADGGLSAELAENRSFGHITPEYDVAPNEKGGTKKILKSAHPRPGYGWEVLKGSARYIKDAEDRYFMRLWGSGEGAALLNSSFGGFSVKEGMDYNIKILASPSEGAQVRIFAQIFREGDIAASCPVERRGETESHEGTLRAPKSCSNCRLSLSLPELSAEDYIDIKFVSAIPDDAVMGIFRRDLAEAIRDLKPAFMRFPGGCVAEGSDLKNAYRWKNTVGPAPKRKQDFNRWAFGEEEPRYNQSFALGFYEYFLLCEYLQCEPLPILNGSMSCQFESGETVPIFDGEGKYTEEFAEYLTDALDLIEFARGGADTKWGGLRSEMGHPEPFRLRMLGIGNEQWQTETNRWFERYGEFEKVIHEKYPDVDLIFPGGPALGDSRYIAAREYAEEKSRSNPKFCFAVDEHNYAPKEWFFDNWDYYSAPKRREYSIPVYLGEYAAKAYESEPNSEGAAETRYNDMISALAEGAFLCGLEQAETVIMASYAPLFSKRQPYSQWKPDLIWFDGETVVKTPNYHVQKLFAENTGTAALKLEADGELYISASLDKDGGIILKSINPSEKKLKLRLVLPPEFRGEPMGEKITLSADSPDARNTFENPNLIVPRREETEIGGDTELLPYSLTVIKIRPEQRSPLKGKNPIDKYVR